jgi:hypothetical protein
VPQRVVGIEADKVDRHGHSTSPTRHPRESGDPSKFYRDLEKEAGFPLSRE